MSTHVENSAVHAVDYVSHVLECVSEYVHLSVRTDAPHVLTNVDIGVIQHVIRHASAIVLQCV